MAMKKHITEVTLKTDKYTEYQCPYCDYRMRLFNDGRLERVVQGDTSVRHSGGILAGSTADVSVGSRSN